MPGAIAHGLLSFGYVGQLLTDWCDGDPGRVRRMRLRFLRPVRPGDSLEVRGRVTGVDGAGCRVDIEVLHDDAVVAHGDATVALATG
jgi:acyl dehydratase